MTLYCAPACDLTPERIQRIEQVIEAIPEDDEDLRQLMEALQYDEAEYAKDCILEHCLDSQSDDREVATISLPGCPYRVRVAGGLSWGDPPSAACTVLEHVERCPQIWQLLEEYAREDAAASEESAIEPP